MIPHERSLIVDGGGVLDDGEDGPPRKHIATDNRDGMSALGNGVVELLDRLQSLEGNSVVVSQGVSLRNEYYMCFLSSLTITHKH